jgi:DNA-binding Lrp family transcriptional regulator
MLNNTDTRFKIIKILVDATRPLTLATIAKKMKTTPQKILYHLDFLVGAGVIIKDGYEYFPQPILIDDDLHDLCVDKIAEIITAFSEKNDDIAVMDEQDPETVALNILYVLIELTLP